MQVTVNGLDFSKIRSWCYKVKKKEKTLNRKYSMRENSCEMYEIEQTL